MLLPVETPHDDIISGCRVHDMVLDMICVLAKEENFVTILGSNEQYTSSHTNARRLAIQERTDHLASAPMLQLRSLNAMCRVDKLPSLSCFEVLRVLNLSTPHVVLHKLEHLGKLVHLRYLRLGGTIDEVREEIGYLQFLQVLDLAGNISINRLPQSISRLSQLKCLNADTAIITVATDWIGNLTSLQELCVNSVEDSSNFVTELGKLTELRKLRICGLLELNSVSSINALTESLVKLKKIQVIDVWKVLSRDTAVFILEGYVLPLQLRVFKLLYNQPGLLASIKPSCLPNLSHLSVHVDSPDLEIFGKLPGLVALSLRMSRAHGHHVMGSAGVGLFPKLRFYDTGATPGRFLPGAMRSLESLKFSVDVWTSRDGNIDFEFGSLVNLPMLHKVTVSIWSGDHIKEEDWRKAEETVRHAVDIHPNNPTLFIENCRGILSSLDDPDLYGV